MPGAANLKDLRLSHYPLLMFVCNDTLRRKIYLLFSIADPGPNPLTDVPMNIATRINADPMPATKRAPDGHGVAMRGARVAQGKLGRIATFDSYEAAAEIWREASGEHFLASPFQDFRLLRAWHAHLGARAGLGALIVVGFDLADRPVLILPLSLERGVLGTIAHFAGGSHTTFNMAMWHPDFIAMAPPEMIEDLRAKIAAARPDIDLLCFERQPDIWDGRSNPFLHFGGQPSVNCCPAMTIDEGAAASDLISNSMRKRLRGKERKLQSLPGYRHTIAREPADITRLIDAFFTIKPERMAQQKLPNMFAAPGVEAFMRDAFLRGAAAPGSRVAIHGLECDDEVLALYIGLADGTRASMMYNTYTMSEQARFSPGLILVRHMVDYYATRGYRMIDLGIGSAEYKSQLLKSQDRLFDSFVALTARGRVLAALCAARNQFKRFIKRHDRLMRIVRATERIICPFCKK